MTVDLRLCDTHFPTTSELSQFVLASPTAKQRMLEPLALVQEESFRKRGQRDFETKVLKARFEKLKFVLYMQVKSYNNSSQYITIGREIVYHAKSTCKLLKVLVITSVLTNFLSRPSILILSEVHITIGVDSIV